GGKNWDEAIAGWFADQFSNETGVAADVLMNDAETWQELVTAAENAKVALSSRKSFPYLVRHDVDKVKVELTREKFDELTANLLGRTLSLTEELLETAKSKGHSKVDKLLLVGGSTYMPQVIEAVKSRFSFDTMQFDPNQAVAKGAAVFGFKCYLDEQIRIRIAEQTGTDAAQVDVQTVPEELRSKAEREVAQTEGLALPALRTMHRQTIGNVTSKSFGIVVVDQGGAELVNNLVKINDAVPCVISRTFGTYEENQLGVTLRCMENTERVGADDQPIGLNTSTEVGSAELRFTRALPRGSRIEIKFALAQDGLLSVHGKDLTTDQEIAAEFKTEAILSEAEVAENKARNMAITVA
ncbi:MAG TPA: Hsp70 family protein, partial [Thermoanaerobaculia bacterium]|nr:Hsp70 family protein [Thermoanaerobaculia bacterium]